MRKISASYIVSNVGEPLKNGILILNDDNSVADLIDRNGSVKEIENLEYYSGVLVPGFVDVFTFLSWPEMRIVGPITYDLSSIRLGEQGDLQSIQKGINHLSAFGTKGAADFHPISSSYDLKLKSNVNFKNITKTVEYSNSILGRTFLNNISEEKAFCIGTGSLASHTKLSVFEELKYLQANNPNLNLERLIEWACLNGAEILGFKDLGSFAIGKKPGVNLITHIDYDKFCLKADSKLKVLI